MTERGNFLTLAAVDLDGDERLRSRCHTVGQFHGKGSVAAVVARPAELPVHIDLRAVSRRLHGQKDSLALCVGRNRDPSAVAAVHLID